MAVRCHFARFGQVGTCGDAEAFDALRRFVKSKRLCDEVSADDFAAQVIEVAGCETVGTECEQRIRVRRDGLTGYADTRGKVVIEPVFDEAGDFAEGRAKVKVNGRMGLIDKAGRWVIQPRYESLEHYVDCGISLVLADGVWSALDYDGYPMGIYHARLQEVARMLNERMKITIEI